MHLQMLMTMVLVRSARVAGREITSTSPAISCDELVGKWTAHFMNSYCRLLGDVRACSTSGAYQPIDGLLVEATEHWSDFSGSGDRVDDFSGLTDVQSGDVTSDDSDEDGGPSATTILDFTAGETGYWSSSTQEPDSGEGDSSVEEAINRSRRRHRNIDVDNRERNSTHRIRHQRHKIRFDEDADVYFDDTPGAILPTNQTVQQNKIPLNPDNNPNIERYTTDTIDLSDSTVEQISNYPIASTETEKAKSQTSARPQETDDSACLSMPDNDHFSSQNNSLCPWQYVRKTDADRFPETMYEAVCLSKTCRYFSNGGNKGCEPLYVTVPVLRRRGRQKLTERGEAADLEHTWMEEGFEKLAVACVCAVIPRGEM